jgi:hypothetical protein
MLQVWAELKSDGAVHRLGGTAWGPLEIPLDSDPTKQVIDAAYEGRNRHFGDLYGHLAMGSEDLSQWDLYSAPFRVEIADNMPARLHALLSSGAESRLGTDSPGAGG